MALGPRPTLATQLPSQPRVGGTPSQQAHPRCQHKRPEATAFQQVEGVGPQWASITVKEIADLPG